MKRNWEIIREILQQLESATTANSVLNAKDLSNYPEQDVAYNMLLLHEGGYIKADMLKSNMEDGQILAAMARQMTNAGHELLDTIRNDTVWSKIVESFQSKGIDMTFDLVISNGRQIMQSLLS
ncbi:MAG: DUF2513 domain-containing protein [Candidatus Promineifilaceae bacterium]